MTFDELNNLKAVARKYGGLNLGEVDQLISTAERHLASAEQVRQMREALEELADAACPPCDMNDGEGAMADYDQAQRKAKAALALTPSQAEQQAKANAEKAALLDEAHKHLVFALTLIRQCRTPSSPDWQADYATLLAFVFDLGEELEDKATKEATNA